MPPAPPTAAPQPFASEAAFPARGGEPPRIRFAGLSVSRTATGRCRATVTLERTDGRLVDGAADVEASAAGDLRAGATAALDALRHAADTSRAFTLLGVKSIRAFDRQVVLVNVGVAAPGERMLSLVGSAFAEGDVMRATVLAVLNATNRVLWAPDGRFATDTPAVGGDLPAPGDAG